MAGNNILSDQDLLNAVKEGGQPAFNELYNRYKVPLYLHAYRMLNDEEESKDVVQEVFTYIWAKRAQLNISKAIDAYLYGSIRNNILTRITHKKVESKYIDSLNRYIENSVPSGDEKLIEKQLLEMFEKEVALLPSKMREVFELSRKDGLSYQQISDKMGISDKTVKKQISNALKILYIKLNVRLFILLFL